MRLYVTLQAVFSCDMQKLDLVNAVELRGFFS